MAGFQIVATVGGSVRFPNHPEHIGHGGVVGGEDVHAIRRTFRTGNEAARWCEKVMRGEIKPRHIEPQGPMIEPAEGPWWSWAAIVAYGVIDEDGQETTLAWYSDGPGTRWVKEA